MELKILAAAMAVSLSACGYYHEDLQRPAAGGAPAKSGEPAPLNFAAVKAAIFSAHCTGCHAGFAEYARVAGRLPDIQRVIDANVMPKNAAPLSPELKTMLASWIEAGAPEL